MKPRIMVKTVDLAARDQGTWSFRDSQLTWRAHRYVGETTFDPFPAYRHNLADVNRAVALVTSRVRPLWDVDLFVVNREEFGRSNGFSNIHHGGAYDDDGVWQKSRPTGMIVLSGKRIPIHPGMTPYLVAHEFGHNLEWMLNHVNGEAGREQSDRLLEQYVEVRGLPASSLHFGNGGVWHDSAAEIFACDFRILVCDIEARFWPHLGVPHPHSVPGLADWWHEQLKRMDETEWAPEN